MNRNLQQIVFVLKPLFIGLILFIFNHSEAQLLLENKGRFPENITYTQQFKNGMAYFNTTGYSIVLNDEVIKDSLWHHLHKYKTLKHDFVVPAHRYDVEFVNALKPQIIPSFPSPTLYNFFKGSQPQNWHTLLRSYGKLYYQNIYPNIDWEVLYLQQASKHNFIINPSGNHRNIQLKYEFTSGLSLENGHLKIKTSVGTLIEHKPFAYQIIDNDTVVIPCKYQLKKNKNSYVVSFEVAEYHQNHRLIIDPVLVFSTYSGSQGDNFGFTSTHDSKSNLYGAGIVDGGTGTNSGDFPFTTGAFQTVYSGGQGLAPANLPCDIGINKFDSAGNTQLYGTYLGGGRDEFPHSLVVDNQDNLIVMGTTYSNDFPVHDSAFDRTINGQTDIFVVKLSENGSTMMGGSYIGGSGFDGINGNDLRFNYADDFRGDVIVDSFNNIYVASSTYSANFPVRNAIQSSRASLQDGCVFSFDPLIRKLRFSTYLGGNDDDAMYSIRMYDTFIYVGGGTASNAMAFPVSGHQNAYNGGRADGFIAKMSQKGKLINSTYFGTPSYDQIFFLDIDVNGQVYAAGQTDGDINRTPNTYGSDKKSQFVVRYSPNIAVINLATTFGNRNNNPELSPSAFLVDRCDNIYFSGWGSPIDYDGLHSLTTFGLPISANAIQPTTDNKDFYLLVLNKNASNLLYATYYGGDKTDDHVDGGTSRFDKRGVVYQSVCASCPDVGGNQDFPVTSNVPFPTNLSSRCSNATFKIDFQINYSIDALFSATPKIGCLPLPVQFTKTSIQARQYYWDFGDGSPIDTGKNPIHTYTKPGIFKVKLLAVDSFSCNVSEFDSTFIEVKDVPKAAFEFKTEVCSNEFIFTNLSENGIDPEWNFGDSSDLSFTDNPKHIYTKDGYFKVLLKVTHPTSGCTDTQSTIIPYFNDPLQSIKIPNAFTPNNDKNNDCYTIGGLNPGCDEAKIWIYNRWGILVFEGTLPNECWTGYLNNSNEPLTSGIYYYILELDSKRKEFSDRKTINGVIHLIK